VDEHGHVKVLDFGLAKLTETVAQASACEADATRTVKPHTAEGTIMGTAAYMSPEQGEGKTVDARSDIFSFGAVLYEMLSGRRAFSGVVREEPKPVEELPRDIQKTIARCLRTDPVRRIQTMADLKVALEDLKEESDSGTLETVAHESPRRRKRLRWVGAAVPLVH
jgi:serine/threonine protein kinase